MRRTWLPILCLLAALALVAGRSLAQEQQPATSTTDQTASSDTSQNADDQDQIEQSLQGILDEPATGETFRYDPQGRRDPFRSLIGPTPKLSRKDAPPGVPGFMIDEIDLQGIVRTKDGLVALIKGPDNKGYSVRAGDKVYDGEVLRITDDSVVFRQEVNDPTRIERHREVVKELKDGNQEGRP